MRDQPLDRSEIPDYENYDYNAEWIDRSIEDSAEKEIIASLIGSRQICLELGGGFGRITSILEPRVVSTVMIDYSVSSLQSARSRLKSAMLMRSDIRALPFRDNLFDLVIAIRVLHHIRNPEELIREMVRVSRECATVVLAVPNPQLGLHNRVGQGQKAFVGKWGHLAYVNRSRTTPTPSSPSWRYAVRESSTTG